MADTQAQTPPEDPPPPPAPEDTSQDVVLGVFDKTPRFRLTPADIIAAILSAFWIAFVAVYFFFVGGQGRAEAVDSLSFYVTLIAIFLPVAMIWVAASAAKSAMVMREEAARLRSAINALRQSYVTQQQNAATGLKPSVEQKLDEIAAAQKQTETAIATFTSSRERDGVLSNPGKAALQRSAAGAEAQPTLALEPDGAQQDLPPLSVADFIRAMHFPETTDDIEGFRALRMALKDPQVGKLVQASQDVLTLLSQEGIYMDDLRPDRARPEIWRRFAQGERGRAIAGLGGVRDRSCLALAAARMRQDPIFRDSVHHFLRLFDQTFAAFEANASDQEIVKLSETRTSRAFMLLGRVTGTFT